MANDKIIESLITQLSFDFDDKAVSKYDQMLKSVVKTSTAIVTTAIASTAAIFGFTAQMAKFNDEIGKSALRYDVDIEALQELGYVAELNGGSVDSMTSALANLSTTASEAARGVGGNVETFGMLGVSVTDATGNIKKADDLLMELSDSIVGLNTQAERLEFSQKLGFSEDLLLTIQRGSKAIAAQRAEAKQLNFAIGVEGAKAAEAFNDEMLKQRKIILGVSNSIGTKLMKHFIPYIKATNDWFKANNKIIKQRLVAFLEKLEKGITAVFSVMRRVSSAIVFLVDKMGGLEQAISVVAAALFAMNLRALLMPALIVAVAAGILLLLEDIQKFAEGGDSAIGNLAERVPEFDAALKTTIDLLKMVRDGWKEIFENGEQFLNDLIDTIREVGTSLDDYVIKKINEAVKAFNKISPIKIKGEITSESNRDYDFGGAIAGFRRSNRSENEDQFGALDIRSIFKKLGEYTLPYVKHTAMQSPVLEAAGGTNNNQSTSVTNHNNNTFTITGDNPEMIGQVVEKKLNEVHRDAQENLSTPVRQ